jgi:GH18 family chitinase
MYGGSPDIWQKLPDPQLQQLSLKLQDIFNQNNNQSTGLKIAGLVMGCLAGIAGGFALRNGMEKTAGGLGIFSEIFGSIFGFAGDQEDPEMDEIKDALTQMENDIVTLNQNLIDLSTAIRNDFDQISKEIEEVYNEIKQVEKDIEIDVLVQLIDQNLTTVNVIVSDYLNMLHNVKDSETLKSKADLFLQDSAGSLHIVYDTLFQQVVDASSGISDSAFLDLLSTKMYLSNGNISYTLWYQAVQNYVYKLNFAIVQGCLAIAWATDLSDPSNSATIAAKYKDYLSHYFNKLYLLEPGLFYPLNDASLSFIGKDNNTELQFSFTRQATGDVVEIINTTNQDIELCQLQIITNYKMSDVNPGFWGDMLYPDPVRGSGWQGTLKDSTNPVIQEIIYDSYDSSGNPMPTSKPLFACYTIKYQNAKFLAGGKATLNISFSSRPDGSWTATGLSGLQGAAMLPIISVVNSTYKQTLTCTNIALMDVNSKTHTLPDINTTTFKNQKRVVGYFPNYGMYNANQPYFATDIPFDKLNVISYCFGQFDGDGNVSSQDSWADSFNLPVIQYVLSRNPSLMGELLFGGWPDESVPTKAYSTMFKSISSDPVKRKNFAKNAVTAMLQIGFTGIGIDWEYPEGTDATNYLLLLKAIKQELNTVGANKYTLSVVAPASIGKIDVLNSDQWKQLSETVDFINVMTYDYNGAWGTITDFNTPLMTNPNNPNYNSNKDNCVDGTISHFLNIAKTCQISPTKFAMGIAAYGRGFLMDSGVVTNENQGLYVNHVPNKVPNTPDKTGIFKNYEILAKNNFPSDMELIDLDFPVDKRP